MTGMIISLKFENFRSYRNSAEFSFEALDSDFNTGSVTTISLKDGSNVRILNSAAIFGANASGKSNVINALKAISTTVAESRNYTPDIRPLFIQPYAFDKKFLNRNTKIKIEFILDGRRYVYSISGKLKSIDQEKLIELRGGRNLTVFTRKSDSSISTGQGWTAEKSLVAESNILPNQLFLSSLATKEAGGLQNIANYIADLPIFTGTDNSGSRYDRQVVMQSVIKSTDSSLFKKLEALLKIADLGIARITAKRNDDSNFQFPPEIDDTTKKSIIEAYRWNITLGHKTAKPNEICLLPFDFESEGTKAIFGVGARLLEALQNGSFVAYDEISDAIHPALLRFIVSLFHSPKSNPKGAQLLFSTHDASVADQDTFRADQVWFVEKKNSISDLFSAQDFSDVDIHVPFEQWYRAGRFGALPDIGDFEELLNL